MKRYLLMAMLILPASCSQSEAIPFTLYKNSSVEFKVKGEQTLRNHFATFDAKESNPSFNQINCEMVAQMWNANIRVLNPVDEQLKIYGRSQVAGFWCEPGIYEVDGPVPSEFKAKFPVDIY